MTTLPTAWENHGPIGRRTLLRLANEGIVPVVWWEGARPFFSDIALDEWQRRMERGAA